MKFLIGQVFENANFELNIMDFQDAEVEVLILAKDLDTEDENYWFAISDLEKMLVEQKYEQTL